MKKTYSTPEMKAYSFQAHDVIATSEATIDKGTGTAPGVAEGNQRGNAIWD